MTGIAKDVLGSNYINGIPGIYVLEPNSINGKSHWLQESGSNAIFYNTLPTGEIFGWGIDSLEDGLANILSFDKVASPLEAGNWKGYNGTTYIDIAFHDVLVEAKLNKVT